MSRYEVALAHMVIGGIPYYMEQMHSDRSLAENIEEMFFDNSAAKQEFHDVYVGLFSSSDKYIATVRALGKNFYGLTRNEISTAINMKTGGDLTKLIENLELSGIIRHYTRYGAARKETVYQLADFFSLFYLRFIENAKTSRPSWQSVQRTGQFFAWAGISFELVVIAHIQQLQKALGIPAVSECYCWRGMTPDEKGVQIDLVIEWDGGRIDYLCEMKFTEAKYTLTKDDEENMLEKVDVFLHSKQRKPSHSLLVALVTSHDMRDRRLSSTVNMQVTLDDLFDS